MSEPRPYQQQRSIPLSAGARFIRGFKRVGIVAGVLVFLGGLALTFILAAEQQSTAQRKFEQANCIADLVRNKRPFKMKSYDQTRIDYADSGCPGWFTYESVETVLVYARSGAPAPLEHAVQPFFVGLAISLACGGAVFVSLWAIGWLCAGFTRD